MGGYAAAIADLIRQPGEGSGLGLQLVAVCDPQAATFTQRAAELRGQGVQVLDNLEGLLALPGVEAVWLPVPIDLHRPFFEQALQAGKAVMCEKPAAGCIDDLDAMIGARAAAGLPAAIGFQDIYAPWTLAAKRAVLAGKIGQVRQAAVWGCWPRGRSYFDRATWAGKWQRNGAWVLDSPVNNAMAHFVNLALFMLGPGEDQSAQPLALEAELYRGNDIESFDTASIRVHLVGGATLLILLTHVCETGVGPTITLQGDQGSLRIMAHGDDMWRTDDGVVLGQPSTLTKQQHMAQRFAALVRGQSDTDRAVASLEVARPQTLVVSAAVQAAAVAPIPAEVLRVVPLHQTTVQVVPGIHEWFERCAAAGQMLHESGQARWTTPAARIDALADYRHFAGPASTAGCSVA
jgi:predicted dehydrogenase